MSNVNSQSIQLRPLSIDDYETVLNWSKDEAFCLANEWDLNRDSEELYHWWRRCVNHIAEDFIRLGIEVNDQLVGYADLAGIKNQTAELGIAIGESTLWGNGIGFKATTLMMDYGAKNWGITVINAETHVANTRSRKMLEKIGFKEVSRIGSEEYLGMKSRLIQYRHCH